MVKLWRALWCSLFHRWVYYDRVNEDGSRTPTASCTECDRGW